MFTQPDLKTDSTKIQLLPQHQQVLSRFVEVCQSDERVVAAFLVGSYAKGTADPFAAYSPDAQGERPILHHYHDKLIRCGVSGDSWEQLPRTLGK